VFYCCILQQYIFRLNLFHTFSYEGKATNTYKETRSIVPGIRFIEKIRNKLKWW